MSWIYSMFISLCLMLDNVIYTINKLLFSLFMEISNLRFSQEIFNDFCKQLYVIIGIFMMFRVAFSMLQMITNPDIITDKEKGAGKIATRVVIALCLIMIVPTIFAQALELQHAIIKDNLIPQLILGKSSNAENQNTSIQDQGSIMSLKIFKSLIGITDGIDENNADVISCKEALNDDSIDIYGLTKVNGVDCFTKKVDDKYIFDYRFIVSTIATGMVAWLLVGFCIDIGVRLVKLTFLQLIAPIPITSYVSGSKDNPFNKWVKLCISTYVSVFVKLIVIYFMIYIAGLINPGNLINIDGSNANVSGLAYVAIILGLLVFAKNAPKLIGDLFGIKMDEESGFKGIAKTALLGGAAATAAGGAAGISNLARGIGNTIGNVKDARASGASGWGAGLKGAFGTLGSMAGGIAAGGFMGAKNGFGKNAKLGTSINKALMQSNENRERRADRNSIGYGIGSRAMDYARGLAGMDTSAKAGAITAKNRLAGLQSSRSVLANSQYEHSKGIDPAKLAALSKYTYDSKANSWMDSNGQAIDTTTMYTEIAGTDFNRSYYERPDGTFDQASYDRDVQQQMEMLYSDEFKYLQETQQISELDGQIIKAQKEVSKWETEQNAVERKTSSGNK